MIIVKVSPQLVRTFATQVAAAPEELRWQDMSIEELTALASTQALFGGTQTFVLAGAIASERGQEFLDMAKTFAESPHTFIFEEEKLLKAPAHILEKAGAKIEKSAQGGSALGRKEWKFDQFGVAAALGAKDRKKLWLGLMASFRAGEKAEAVAGLLAWKARAMRDVNLSRELTFMYHDSHRGAGDLELLLERFALKL
ncbi:MAG: hypothetical protein AAB449_00520 [Patescibacteria group bacterium]